LQLLRLLRLSLPGADAWSSSAFLYLYLYLGKERQKR